MENGDRIKIHEDIATLKAQVSIILINHLPHLSNDIKALSNKFNDDIKMLNKKVWWFITLLITNLVGLLVSLVFGLIKVMKRKSFILLPQCLLPPTL